MAHARAITHKPLTDVERCELRTELLLVELRCLVVRLDDVPISRPQRRPRSLLAPQDGPTLRVGRLSPAHRLDLLKAIWQSAWPGVMDGERIEGRVRERP